MSSPKRKYRSVRREEQAAETRNALIDAARRLFATRGYVATSIGDLAQEAGVAVQTIYTSVGGKAALLAALVDRMDEEAHVPELSRRMSEATDPRELIALQVLLTRQLNERCGDIMSVLRSAAPSEPGMEKALQEGLQRHRSGCRQTAALLRQIGALRADLTAETAGDIIALLTGPDTWAMLTGQYGWSYDECERWLVETLCTLLLAASSVAPPTAEQGR